jgi:hypothetical protein
VLPEPLRSLRCGLSLGDDQHRFPLQLWPGSTTKAAVTLEVTLPVEAFAWSEREEPVETVVAQVAPAGPPPPADAAEPDPPPVLRRRGQGGALVMEGRRRPDPG